MTDNSAQYIYDEIPYPSYSFTQSHPDHLATLATLLGMVPAPVERCRVLELGCASGGNLIPMAQCLPDSSFIGVDLSARQVAEGQAGVEALGLKNITLLPMNILDVDASLGQFDYIIAHGIYSWVPPNVQDKILMICREQLAPNGVAYVSYNIYPGWHMLGSIRDMLLYHTRHISDPSQQVAEARRFLEFLNKWVPSENDSYASVLSHMVDFIKERMMPKQDAYFLHDTLAEINEPVYFFQFAEHAARHGLRYLADAQFHVMLATNLPPELADTLRQFADNTVELEQYLDFLRNRPFRQSLLCQQEIQLSARLKPERLAEFYIASSVLPVEQDAPADTAAEKFHTGNGAAFTTDHPVTKAAMRYLSEIWPRAVPFNVLLAEAQKRTGLNSHPLDPEEAQMLGFNLLQAYGYNDELIELHVHPPQLVVESGEYPTASPVARWQVQFGQRVTNLRHEQVNLDDTSCQLLPYLDGAHDRPALLTVLEEWAAEDHLEIEKKDGQRITDVAEVRQVLTGLLDIKLRELGRTALLVG